MLNKFALMLSIMFALTAPNAHAAGDRTEPQTNMASGTEFKAPRSSTKFLKSLSLRFTLSPDDPLRPQFCARLSDHTQCPPIVSNGGVAGGGIPTIEPVFKTNLPNVRVSFFIQEITNQVITNGGVETTGVGDFIFVNWTTTGTQADVENGGPYGWTLPGPGQTYDEFDPHGGSNGLLIYDALVIGACGSFSSFPVEHNSKVTEVGDEIGLFLGIDNSTINSTGYYNLNYTVSATDGVGGVSDFHFSGIVSVTCSALNVLP